MSAPTPDGTAVRAVAWHVDLPEFDTESIEWLDREGALLGGDMPALIGRRRNLLQEVNAATRAFRRANDDLLALDLGTKNYGSFATEVIGHCDTLRALLRTDLPHAELREGVRREHEHLGRSLFADPRVVAEWDYVDLYARELNAVLAADGNPVTIRAAFAAFTTAWDAAARADLGNEQFDDETFTRLSELAQHFHDVAQQLATDHEFTAAELTDLIGVPLFDLQNSGSALKSALETIHALGAEYVHRLGTLGGWDASLGHEQEVVEAIRPLVTRYRNHLRGTAQTT